MQAARHTDTAADYVAVIHLPELPQLRLVLSRKHNESRIPVSRFPTASGNKLSTQPIPRAWNGSLSQVANDMVGLARPHDHVFNAAF